MARLKPPYGTTAQLTSNVVQERELAYDSTLQRFVMGDGSDASGRPLALEDDGDTVSVTATGTTTARNLADRFADLGLCPLDEGAGGAGAADDTTAFQTVLNLMGEGDATRAPAGTEYSVTNLTHPSITAAGTSGVQSSLYCADGMAMVTARSGGSADYLFAPARWLTADANKAFTQQPFMARNIVFDANGLKSKGVVGKSFWLRFFNCYFIGATDTDFELTRQAQDGTAQSSGYNGDGIWFASRWFGTGSTYQFRSRGTAADDLDASTDGALVLNAFDGQSAADYGVTLGDGGGWIGALNRLYGHATAGAWIKRVSRGFMWALNNMDAATGIPAMIVGALGSFKNGVIGPGNKWYAKLQADFTADGSSERFVVLADHFISKSNPATTATAVHNNNNANKELVLLGCVSLADYPYERGAGNTAGIVKVFNSWCGDAFIASLQDDPSASAGPVARHIRRSASPAASDVLKRDEYYGDDSAGNLTLYAATETYIVDTTDTQEDGGYRVKIMHEGSEITGLSVTHFLAQSLPGGQACGRSVAGEGAVTDQLSRYSADVTPAILTIAKARGTIASPGSVSQFDEAGRITFSAYGGGAFRDACYFRSFIQAATPSGTDMESDGRFYVNAASSVSPAEILRLRHSSGVRAYPALAIPAGGVAGSGFTFSSTANFGTFFGSGAPTLAAAQGSLYLRSDGANPASRTYVNSDGSTTWKPLIAGGVQTLSGAGAIDITNRITKLTTTAADALTLADGVEGQEKIIVMIADGGDGTLTPTNLANLTTITFNDVGDAVTLVFLGTEWWVVHNNGCTLA